MMKHLILDFLRIIIHLEKEYSEPKHTRELKVNLWLSVYDYKAHIVTINYLIIVGIKSNKNTDLEFVSHNEICHVVECFIETNII